MYLLCWVSNKIIFSFSYLRYRGMIILLINTQNECTVHVWMVIRRYFGVNIWGTHRENVILYLLEAFNPLLSVVFWLCWKTYWSGCFNKVIYNPFITDRKIKSITLFWIIDNTRYMISQGKFQIFSKGHF